MQTAYSFTTLFHCIHWDRLLHQPLTFSMSGQELVPVSLLLYHIDFPTSVCVSLSVSYKKYMLLHLEPSKILDHI